MHTLIMLSYDYYVRYINNALQKLYSRYNDYVRYVNDVSCLMILVT
jgi:hypothetical protein